MKLAYLVGGQVVLDPAVVDAFCARYPAVYRAFEHAAQRTGLPLAQLLAGRSSDDDEPQEGDSLGAVGQAALVIGLSDSLTALGVGPHAVGGVSLGALTSSCLAGAIDRGDLFDMLHHQRLVPPLPATARKQGMAVAVVPAHMDPSQFYGEDRDGVYLAVDHGPVFGGERHVLVVGGYVDALQELIATAPSEVVRLIPAYSGAFHTPLQQHTNEFMKQFVAGIPFLDPEVPICSPVRAGALRTADEVRKLFAENYVTPIGIKPLADELAVRGTEVAVELGPGFPQGVSMGSMRQIRITHPDDLEKAV
ncbi:hypothetical protein [Nocardia rhizosphaerihabitans]|uniref:[acyl-carrier-protein] S-malonyltransferase n=1 Tax=Nocardia rhizosphaerihabitans TaxID=1691570 RepID=A0ABQ2K692_9NOCA|nr:hypothetical protein [Nocardia rhizosphaerihabitans]GGN71991.1 malonyl CoA-acyl carrier protein transacylase [Nocardia rhizosphaerihabitans]